MTSLKLNPNAFSGTPPSSPAREEEGSSAPRTAVVHRTSLEVLAVLIEQEDATPSELILGMQEAWMEYVLVLLEQTGRIDRLG